MKRRDFLKTATVPILCAPVITDAAASQEPQDCCDRMAPGTRRNYDSLDWDVPPTILDGEYIPQCQALYAEQLEVANVLLHPTVSWEIQEPIAISKHWTLFDKKKCN